MSAGKLVVAGLCAGLLSWGCWDKKENEPPQQPTVEQHSILVFPQASPMLDQIVAVPVEPRREVTLRFNGRLVWNEDRTARVFAPFAGRVQSIEARPGERVARGQALAVLAAPDFGVAQAEARKAENDYSLAQKNLERIRELAQAGVAPAKDLQAAEAEVARTASERARANARLKLYGKDDTVDQRLALRSPVAGVVVERNLNPGQELRTDSQGDKPLFVVSDPARLWFLLDVSEQDIARVKAGTEVKLSTASLGEDRISGRVMHVAELVDPQTRTVKVRGVVDEPDERLKAEMFTVAELKLPAASGYLVPTRAVYLRGEQHFVFIDQGAGRYARRAIVPGPISDGYQAVLGGIAATDKVVVDGNLLLERLLASKD
ncbi:MAG TPA: efflux RND transporter periplasmic adaptor subunit [Burkholderiales bacterium]|jgi:cobalt-zinc-cadmium efflux system membrane fusion protein